MATRKRAQKPRRKATPKKSTFRAALRRSLFFLLIVGIAIGIIGLVLLDTFVRSKFEGVKWALPAHVYSRSLEIYEGLPLRQDQLRWELDQLGYRAVSRVTAPGQYSVNGSRMDLYTRQFRFMDGEEAARAVTLVFRGNRVVDIIGAGNSAPLVRLEPMIIGGIYPEHLEDRVLVRLKEVPPYLVQALLSVEDQDFYKHIGVSPKSILRALVSNIRAGTTVQGGSTITQQLVKNFYLTHERSLVRKGMEAVMAVLLEIHYGKEQILEAYLNEVYLGQAGKRAIHGFGMASQHLFRQPLRELELHQLALMVGMVKGASYYDPWRNPERALARRNLVLDVMADRGVISTGVAATAKGRGLDIAPQPGTATNPYPDYLQLVREQLARDYRQEDLQSAGLRIFTHLDPQVQRQMQSSVSSVVDSLEKGYKVPSGQLQAASVVVRTGTGEVLALTGNRRAGFVGFNRAVDARRQVGSTIKPAVYLAALSQPQRYTLGTLIDDSPLSIRSGGQLWEPRNYSRESHGLVPLYQALGNSYNQATARLGIDVGLDRVAATLRALGFEGPLDEVPAMLLGSVEMSPLEVATMYHTIAAEGFYSPLRTIQAVYTAEHEPLRRYPFNTEQRFSPALMHLLNYGLQVVMREGTGRGAYRRLPESVTLAGKTGTTNDQRDSWFAGFADNYVGVVWLGRDDNGKTPFTGSSGALQVWADMMAGLNVGSVPFAQPEGVEYYWVEPATQSLSREGCQGSRYLPYIPGSEPKRRSPCFQRPGEKVIDWFQELFGNE